MKSARVAGELLLVRDVGPRDAEAGRQDGGGEALHGGDGVARAVARRGVALDLRGREHVVAHDAIRAAPPLHVEHRAERHHAALRVAGLQALDVGGVGAEAALRLRPDLERAPEAVEVVHVRRAQVDLERVEDVAQRHVQLLRLHAVDVGVELRRAGPEGGEDAAQRRLAVGGGDQLVGGLLQRLEAATRRGPRTSSLKPPAVPRPRTGGGGNDEDLRVLDLGQPVLQGA